MLRVRSTAPVVFLLMLLAVAPAASQVCVECHEEVTPRIVTDWQHSKHASFEVTCSVCHGDGHTTADDASEVTLPTPEVCGACHDVQLEQFGRGKHALAWKAMQVMPTTHWQPMVLTEGVKGCGGCHKIGFKSDEEIRRLKAEGSGFGVVSCDACHTRHLFSVDEAAQPDACRTCHMGFDHPQWEMYSSSKHGVRYNLVRDRILPWSVAAPTCQDCHMQQGNHEVRTAWGFLALRMPLPDDEEWAADRTTILQALGVLDPQGKPTARLEAIKIVDVARLTVEAWQAERAKMLDTCNECHSRNFAKSELAKGDEMIRQADALMAEAIRIVAGLYADGVLQKPASYEHPFPDLLTFHDAPTTIENALFVMFLEHRQRAFQGTFHSSPEYALWYGWSEMQRDLTEIRELAERLRREDRMRGAD